MRRRSPAPNGTGLHEIAGQVVSPSKIPVTADDRPDAAPFRLLTPLTDAEYEAPRAGIASRGIVVPAVVDQRGRILEGRHRRRVADDDEAADLAVILNAARRYLTREQRRELIGAEIQRRPGEASDCVVARRVGCSPSTVAAVRRVSNVDTRPMNRAEAESLTAATRNAMGELITSMQAVCITAITNAIPATELADAIGIQHDAVGAARPEVLAPVRELLFHPLLDGLAGCAA